MQLVCTQKAKRVADIFWPDRVEKDSGDWMEEKKK